MGNPNRPWVILKMNIRPPRIRRWERGNNRNRWKVAPYVTYQGHFTNFRATFCTFSNAFAPRDRMGCLNSIFKMWPDKNFVQGKKMLGVRATKDLFRYKSTLRTLATKLFMMRAYAHVLFNDVFKKNFKKYFLRCGVRGGIVIRGNSFIISTSIETK